MLKRVFLVGLSVVLSAAVSAAMAQSNTGSAASPTGPAQECTVRNYDWGALGSEVVKTWGIGPITVTASTDYQPIVTFDVSRPLLLFSSRGHYGLSS